MKNFIIKIMNNRSLGEYLKNIIPFNVIKRPFLLLCAIYSIAITAIVRANVNYVDDLGRTARGYRGWENFGRYLSNYLSTLIHASKDLTDISPLPQLITVILISLASVIIIYLFSNKHKISFWSTVAAIPIGLSPYFLECFSYKFDSPYMALSILASVTPALFFEEHVLVYSLSIAIGTLIMSMTYQASSGIFALVILFLLAVKWNEGTPLKKLFNKAMVSFSGYIVAMIIFYIWIAPHGDTYVSRDISPYNMFIQTIQSNILRYFKLLKEDYQHSWKVLAIILCFSFVITFIHKSQRNKILSAIVAFILIVVGSVLSFGAYTCLPKPSFAPRAMYGFGVYIALIGIIAVNNCKITGYLPKITAFCLAWCLFAFTFTYGNALAEQKRYADFRIQMVLNDLTRVIKLQTNDKKNKYEVQLDGNIGFSPIVNRMLKKHKPLGRLVKVTFGGGWTWSRQYFFNYFSLPNVVAVDSKGDISKKYKRDFTKEDLKTLYDCNYHTIKAADKKILIMLKH